MNKPSTIQEHLVLAPYTTMKVGGPAEFACLPKTDDEFVAAWEWALSEGLTITMLGAGSNSLINDAGIKGLVIIPRNDTLTFSESRVTVGAGVKNGQLIGSAANHNLGGLSWLLGVPGTVGGSLYGNAGTGNADQSVHAIGDTVVWVDVIEQNNQRRRLTKAECGFSYRHSIFKETKAGIISAELELPVVDGKTERALLAATATAKNAKQPTTAASAGCMFKNAITSAELLPEKLRPYLLPTGAISAWRLIDHLGLKGKQIGQMQISEKHGNFMINLGGATADQVVQLISYVKQQVRDKLNIQLQEEVQYLGF